MARTPLLSMRGLPVEATSGSWHISVACMGHTGRGRAAVWEGRCVCVCVFRTVKEEWVGVDLGKKNTCQILSPVFQPTILLQTQSPLFHEPLAFLTPSVSLSLPVLLLFHLLASFPSCCFVPLLLQPPVAFCRLCGSLFPRPTLSVFLCFACSSHRLLAIL